MTLSDLDTRYHDMLRELRRWGITESDGGVEGHANRHPAHDPWQRAGDVIRPDKGSRSKGSLAGVEPCPSDTTEQKKAA